MSKDVKIGIAILIICVLVVMLGFAATKWSKNSLALGPLKSWFTKKDAAAEKEPAPVGEGAASKETSPWREPAAPDRAKTAGKGVEGFPVKKETTPKPVAPIRVTDNSAKESKPWDKFKEAEREKELTSRVKKHYGKQEERVITPTGKIVEVGVGSARAPGISAAPQKDGAAAAVGANGRSYTVQPGDSLTKIAEKIYGDKKYWKRIYVTNQGKLNGKATNLHPGMELVIPEREAVLSAAAEPISPQTRPDFYTVKNRDTLAKIAARFYNDPSKWRSIYKANTEKIKNPDVLVAGLQIRLPDEK